jgi:hypothetical protein
MSSNNFRTLARIGFGSEDDRHMPWKILSAHLVLSNTLSGFRFSVISSRISSSMRSPTAIRNLLRFLKIDSQVFRSRTSGEPFDGAQRIRGLFTISSDALHYDVPAHVSSLLVSRASEP